MTEPPMKKPVVSARQSILIDADTRSIPGYIAIFDPPPDYSATVDAVRRGFRTLGEPGQEDKIRRRLLAANPKELREATQLAEQVRQYLAGQSGRPPEIKKDTWRRKVIEREAARSLGAMGETMPKLKEVRRRRLPGK